MEEFTLYPKVSVDAITVHTYYGSFGSCEVVGLKVEGLANPEPLCYEYIAGYTLVFGAIGLCTQPYLYQESKFYLLDEAYRAGLITAEDVYAIGLMSAGEVFPGKDPDISYHKEVY